MNKVIFIFFLLINCVSCQKDIEKKEAYKQGQLLIGVDPSIASLGYALSEVFQVSYPKISITFKEEVEDLAIADFVNGKVDMAIVSRELTQREKDILYNASFRESSAAQIACDASVFITSKNSSIDKVSVQKIKKELIKKDNKYIFDNGNSSNFNTVIHTLKMDSVQKYIKALTGAEEVIDFIGRNPNHVGVINLGIVSNNGLEYTNKVKIIPVETGNKSIAPSLSTLRSYEYPFTRRIFLLSTESGFFAGTTFTKFAGSQRGQLIVSREGLQPYYIYPRRVQLVN